MIDIQIITIKLKTPSETLALTVAIAKLLVPQSFDTIIADKIDDKVKITDVCYYEINMKRRSLYIISLQYADVILPTKKILL